jgi:hypothetical protein
VAKIKNKPKSKPADKPAASTTSDVIEHPSADGDGVALARISQLEDERANLLAQVAWERAISQEQQKTLESERTRAEQLAADLAAQRSRVEALKALSAWDRVLGRHKAV